MWLHFSRKPFLVQSTPTNFLIFYEISAKKSIKFRNSLVPALLSRSVFCHMNNMNQACCYFYVFIGRCRWRQLRKFTGLLPKVSGKAGQGSKLSSYVVRIYPWLKNEKEIMFWWLSSVSKKKNRFLLDTYSWVGG